VPSNDIIGIHIRCVNFVKKNCAIHVISLVSLSMHIKDTCKVCFKKYYATNTISIIIQICGNFMLKNIVIFNAMSLIISIHITSRNYVVYNHCLYN
jgi:hypothetical protein